MLDANHWTTGAIDYVLLIQDYCYRAIAIGITSAATRKVTDPIPREKDHMNMHSPLRVTHADASEKNENASNSK